MEIAEEKWICCQIGARERYAVARALHQHRALDLLLTDAWVRPHSVLADTQSRSCALAFIRI